MQTTTFLTQRSSLALGAVLPLCLFLTGCNEPVTTSDADRAPSAPAAAPAADNTAINARDRDDATLTPGDQGTSPADREITQKIRKALAIDSSGYSTTAKNIKIITVNGKVTLRGPVNTDAEKSGIVAMARQVAGEANVDDQLEIKTNP